MPKILQLKITLKSSKPQIWRRFLVEDSITFHRLHEIIQRVMGWENYHLYEFLVNELKILKPPEEYGGEPLEHGEMSSKKVRLSLLKAERLKFNYLYDFGDGWKHTITLEKIIEPDGSQKCPVCVDGERSCPPEDCGGIWGYEEFLKAIRNPNHKTHKQMLKWIGGKFDPEDFDIEEINEELSQND